MDSLMLASGANIVFPEANLIIHQPTFEEIGLVGGEDFLLTMLQLININAEKVNTQGKVDLKNVSDFDIFMSVMNYQKDADIIKNNFCKFLMLLFGDVQVVFSQIGIILTSEEQTGTIDKENFQMLKTLVNDMFCYSKLSGNVQDYNPKGHRAKEIAEKLKKAKEKSNKEKSKDGFFGKYLFILSVGMNIDINIIKKMTIYQFFKIKELYEKKMSYDVYLQAQMAGATGMKQVEH